MRLTKDRILFLVVLLILAVLVGIFINEQVRMSHNKFHPIPATSVPTPIVSAPSDQFLAPSVRIR